MFYGVLFDDIAIKMVCLFLFYLISNSLSGGVKSVTAGQRLILNTAFPRMMLPVSATVIAFFKFIPTLLVFMIMRTVLGLPFGWEMLWSIPIILIALIFALGVAILISIFLCQDLIS